MHFQESGRMSYHGAHGPIGRNAGVFKESAWNSAFSARRSFTLTTAKPTFSAGLASEACFHYPRLSALPFQSPCPVVERCFLFVVVFVKTLLVSNCQSALRATNAGVGGVREQRYHLCIYSATYPFLLLYFILLNPLNKYS